MVRSDRKLIVLESTQGSPIQGAKTQCSTWTIEPCRTITGVGRYGWNAERSTESWTLASRQIEIGKCNWIETSKS